MAPEIMTQFLNSLKELSDYTLVCDDFIEIPKLNIHSGKTIEIKWVEDMNYLTELLTDGNTKSQIRASTPLQTFESMVSVSWE